MTLQLILGDDIRNQILRVLSGACFWDRRPDYPELFILSPWISDVEIELTDISSLKDEGEIEYFTLDFNIKSINLAYALLLLQLHSGVEINIITLPPNEFNYHEGWVRVKTLLDFLDEIGCNVFVNSRLHSKLLLANDLALLGSFNLSTSALYDREEIGVSIDDLDNLQRLQMYCVKVIQESERYGYSSLLRYGKRSQDKHILDSLGEELDKPPSLEHDKRIEQIATQLSEAHRKSRYSPENGITRGWLLDYLIEHAFEVEEGGARYREFFDVTGGYDVFIKSYSSNLSLLYLLNLRRLISSPKGKSCVEDVLGYSGDESVDSIMEFVNSKFVRKTIPNFKLRIKALQ